MDKEEIDKSKQKLISFRECKIERDKLEIEHGGFKVGTLYKNFELDYSIDTILNYIQQLEEREEYIKNIINNKKMYAEERQAEIVYIEDIEEVLNLYNDKED